MLPDSPSATAAYLAAMPLQVLHRGPAASHCRRKEPADQAPVRIIGVGGGGISAIERMIGTGICGAEYVAIDADAAALRRSSASRRVRIGVRHTRGLGTGGDMDLGRIAAEESTAEIAAVLSGASMAVVVAGEGGGTASGAAPVVARLARAAGALTIAVVTEPAHFEGLRRRSLAVRGVAALAGAADFTIVIPARDLHRSVGRRSPATQYYAIADDVVCLCVRAFAEIVLPRALIALDAVDLEWTLRAAGSAHVGIGQASGDRRAMAAAWQASRRASFADSIGRAITIILMVHGPPDLTLHEVNEAIEIGRQAVSEDANIIFGTTVLPSLVDEVRVTILAAVPAEPPTGESARIVAFPSGRVSAAE